jgi:phage replication O-like protein O
MASPQVENGHTIIANEIVDAMCRVNLSAYESRIAWFILRKTYGYHKVTDRISYSQFEQGTNLKRWHVARTIEKLLARKIITRIGNGYDIEYAFQKDYELWQPLPNEVTESLPNEVTLSDEKPLPIQVETVTYPGGTVTQRGNETITCPGNYKRKKDKTKEITKEIDCENHPLLKELFKLSGWGLSQLANDVEWLSEFLSEFPEFGESHIRACRDYHSGKRRHTKPQWKARLRNWMKNERKFKQGGNHATNQRPTGTNQGAAGQDARNASSKVVPDGQFAKFVRTDI